MPTSSASSPESPSTPDYATMIANLGFAETVRVMKGDSPFPTVSPFPWLIVMGSILLCMFLAIV